MQANGPVFVVGVNGSGTTMLADAMGKHPDLYMFPRETRVLPYLAQQFPDDALASLTHRRALAVELARSKGFYRSNGDRLLDLEAVDLTACHGFSGTVGSLYTYFARKEGKTRWGDKTPMYLQHISLLAERFPDARFIHIYRDGRDAAQSFHRRWRQEPRRTIWRWKKAIELGRAQGKALGCERYFEVSYEALTGDPESWMRQVCEFADLAYTPAVLQSSMRYMEDAARVNAGGRMIQNSEKWRRYFDAAQIEGLERIAGRALSELGYPVNIAGDADLTALQRRGWKWKDWANFSVHHLMSYGLVGLKPFILRARDALHQDKVNKF